MNKEERNKIFWTRKRGNIKLWSIKTAWSNLNLLSILFQRGKNSLRADMCRNGYKASSYEDVSEYIKLKTNFKK